VAGLTGAGLAPKDILEFLVSKEFRRSWLEMRQILLLPLKRLTFQPHTGLTTGRKALACLKKLLGDRRIEQCESANVSISVTNLTRSRTEIRRSGPLAEIIVASCAYPSVIEQQMVDGDWLWDGGIANDGPIGQWLDNPNIREIFIHSVGSKKLPLKSRIGIFQGILRSHDAIGSELDRLREQLAMMSGQSIVRWNTPTTRPFAIVSEETGRKNFAVGVETGRKAAQEYFEKSRRSTEVLQTETLWR
jgi:predicted acylesterase/phospholipase RssA